MSRGLLRSGLHVGRVPDAGPAPPYTPYLPSPLVGVASTWQHAVYRLGEPAADGEHDLQGDVVNGRHRTRYVPALDGLRGIAILAVLAFHGGMPWATGGFLGVDAFFVLSGNLSPACSSRSGNSPTASTCPLLEATRPSTVAALLVMVAVITRGANTAPGRRDSAAARRRTRCPVQRRELADDPARGRRFAQTAAPSPLEHTWSLGIEEQFYLAGDCSWPHSCGDRGCWRGAGPLASVLRARSAWPTPPCCWRALSSRRPGAATTEPTPGEPVSDRCRAGDPARQALDDGRRGTGPASTGDPHGPDALGGGAALSVVVVGWVWTHAEGSDTGCTGGLWLSWPLPWQW